MDHADLIIPASRLWSLEQPWDRPVAFVDLAIEQAAPGPLRLPPCPTIGLGSPAHPLAAQLDAVIEPGFGPGAMLRSIAAHPRAAATFVQVLRATEGLGAHAALTIESLAYAMLQGSAEHFAWRSERSAAVPGPQGRVAIRRRGGQLDLVLDRAEAGNAIDRPMRDSLAEGLALAASDPSIEQVRLLARGKAFSLGADLAEFGTTTDPATAHAIRCLTLPAREAIGCADRLEAHVDGACVGAGLELAAFASRIVATPRAWFQLPELAMGILPGAGGCVSLPRRIGRQRTALMVLSGRRIGARRALDWGLVDALVDGLPGDEGQGDVA